MKKNRKRILKFLAITIILLIVYILFSTFLENKDNYEKEEMLNDAKYMLMHGEVQIQENILDDNSNVTCLQIYGYEGKYKNSGNYIGSVDLLSNEPYIELSDGKYYVRGTMNDLKIIESNLTASTTCNR